MVVKDIGKMDAGIKDIFCCSVVIFGRGRTNLTYWF